MPSRMPSPSAVLRTTRRDGTPHLTPLIAGQDASGGFLVTAVMATDFGGRHHTGLAPSPPAPCRYRLEGRVHSGRPGGARHVSRRRRGTAAGPPGRPSPGHHAVAGRSPRQDIRNEENELRRFSSRPQERDGAEARHGCPPPARKGQVNSPGLQGAGRRLRLEHALRHTRRVGGCRVQYLCQIAVYPVGFATDLDGDVAAFGDEAVVHGSLLEHGGCFPSAGGSPDWISLRVRHRGRSHRALGLAVRTGRRTGARPGGHGRGEGR